MYVSQTPVYVGLVSRPKFGGLVRHVGVMLPTGLVAHWSPAGAAVVSLAEFGAGQAVSFHDPAPQEQHALILHRAMATKGPVLPYHPLARNCEHYARWVLGETPHSPQVGRMVGWGLIGLTMAMAAR